jgi:sugar O-acyltransferase (sialic acid O-acetyltransferase NeuD family)
MRHQVRDLLVVGGGGFARETVEAVRAVNARRTTWRLCGLLDDSPGMHGTEVAGVPVIGPIELVHHHPAALVVLTTGRPDNYVSRPLIAARLGLPDSRYATIIHPTATVGVTCTVGAGSVLLAHVDMTADVAVGRHVAVMPQVVLPHDALVDDFATIASGVRLGGACHVAEGAYIGAGACLRENITVGPRALVGMGSVVTRHVPGGRVWLGSPASDAGPAPLPALMRESA